MCEYIKENIDWIAPLLVTILFSILNIIVAICNISITKKQRKLQNDSFCFQLYEKRWEIYETIDKLLCSVIQSSTITNDELSQFDFAIHNVRFMFGEDIKEYCDETRKLLLEFRTISVKVQFNIEHQVNDPNHSKLCDEEAELLSLITDQQKKLSIIMEKYILFAGYKVKR